MGFSWKSLAVTVASICAFLASEDGAHAATCDSLSSVKLAHATVTSVKAVTDGKLEIPGADKFPIPGMLNALQGLPPFCRVAVQSTPTPDSHINIEIWLPLGDKWNGKYQQLGCGGFCGSLIFTYPGLAQALRRGYAAAATDDGNTSGGTATFALGHPQRITDFGYRALKETTDISKAIVAAFAGKKPQRSYFVGCSDGGREALMEAQRYPEDFDGIIVGAPANAWTDMFAGFMANQQALLKDPASFIPPSKLPILTKAALAQCAGKDGGLPGDAFLNDPSRCRFDPVSVQCRGDQDPGTCLTPAQVKAAKVIYDGVRDPKTRNSIIPGFAPGNEDDPAGWSIWITGASRESNLTATDAAPAMPGMPNAPAQQGFFARGFFANFVAQVPTIDIMTLDPAAAAAKAKTSVGKVIDATDPDLGPFKRHGGKIIQYHGWADAALTPYNSVNYYNEVRRAISGKPTGDIKDFYRLFMVPGMDHCAGGPGATEIGTYIDTPPGEADHSVMHALERWVEQGVAPEKIIAGHGAQFQRPLCPYPQIAKYDGKGDPTKASSFACGE